VFPVDRAAPKMTLAPGPVSRPCVIAWSFEKTAEGAFKSSVDHLVGSDQKCLQYGMAKCLGGSEVDD
jgi:hypothetical protein